MSKKREGKGSRILVVLIEQLTTCYIWLTLYVKDEITNGTTMEH